MSIVRSEQQLILLLKLVDANNLEIKRQNVEVRQIIWTGIAEKLNSIKGAKKNTEGWKRCYNAWRISAGKDYKQKMQELTRKMPNNDDYVVKVVDDQTDADTEIAHTQIIDPSEKQKQRLHELILKHKQLLLSTADDEPLKRRLWQNITAELNEVQGALHLTEEEWKNLVDWDRYKTKRGRKPLKRTKSIEIKMNDRENVYKSDNEHEKYLNCDETTQFSDCYENLNTHDASSISDSLNEIDLLLAECDAGNPPDYEDENFEDEDELIYEPNRKQTKITPLVKTFKHSNRIVCAVEQLRDDVNSIGEVLKQTTESLNLIQTTLEQQCRQQDEFNTLLKRNTQLLKVLVEFKIGKRSNISKRSFQLSSEVERL